MTHPAGEASLQDLLSRVVSAAQSGDVARAISLAEQGLREGAHHPLLLRLRAAGAQQAGRFEDALADYEASAQLQPPDAGALNAMGLALAQVGRPGEALVRLDEAIRQSPGFAPSHFNRGWALELTGRVGEARAAYERAVVLDPRHVAAWGALATLAARRADWPAARSAAARALRLDPAAIAPSVALAQAEAAQGEAQAAEARLTALLARPVGSDHERAVALAALGDVRDQVGRFAEAFEAYAASATTLARTARGRFPLTTGARVVALQDAFATLPRDLWRRDPPAVAPPPAKGLAFLLGFPRSGGTLLGQALALAPGVQTLDERPLLDEASLAFLGDAAAVQRLAEAGAEEAAHYRDLYWRRVGEAGVAPGGLMVVDKSPMNSVALPVISRLFPDARVILLRRDPRDVVLSSFRRQFVLDPTTVEFLDLASTARFYAAVMTLLETYLEVLPLQVMTLRLEDLVEDFEGRSRAVCDFLGVTWSARMSDVATRAGEVATPSAAQLARGLNAEGVGRWRDYREPLSGVLEALAPWVERFGYPAT